MWLLALSALVAAAFAQTSEQTTPQQPIPCILPPFIGLVPEKQREEIKEIWDAYSPPDDCSSHQLRTLNILDSLTQADKDRLFGQSAVPAVVVPTFVQLMSAETKATFDAIWLGALPEKEKIEKMEEFAEENFDKTQMDDFHVWLSSVKAQQGRMEARIAALSPLSKQIFKRLIQVQIRAEENSLLQSLTQETAKELHGLI